MRKVIEQLENENRELIEKLNDLNKTVKEDKQALVKELSEYDDDTPAIDLYYTLSIWTETMSQHKDISFELHSDIEDNAHIIAMLKAKVEEEDKRDLILWSKGMAEHQNEKIDIAFEEMLRAWDSPQEDLLAWIKRINKEK